MQPGTKIASTLACISLCTASSRADVLPSWTAKLPIGTSLSAGIQRALVDASGVTYVTGTSGFGTSTDVVTAAFDAQGSLVWSRTFDGASHGGDQGRGLALGANGVLWVTGNTPGPGNYANVLVLAYDAASGAPLHAIQWSSGPFESEHGASIVVDAQGSAYVGGGTVGDGADALVLKFDASGQFVWQRTWDGPAFGPFSQDTVQQMALSPKGEPIALIHGVMSSLHADYVVAKLDPDDGTPIYVVNHGVSGGDGPRELELDASGDIYVTGTSSATDRFYTIKLRGTNGTLLWHAYDGGGFHNSAAALALDAAGGVYVTGSSDPDGDQSNQNDDYYTVKRDGATGALAWTHSYGASCVGCLDLTSDVGVDAEGHVFVGGTSSSAPYAGDALTLVLDATTGQETDRGVLDGGPTTYVSSGFLRFAPGWEPIHAGEFYDVNTGELEIAVFEYASWIDGSGPTTYCTAKTSSAGCVATISTSNLDAQPVSGAGDYFVTAWMVQEKKLGLLFASMSGAASLPFNGGTLCANLPLARGQVVASGGSDPEACGGFLSTRVNDGDLFPGGLDAGAGQSAWYQYWFRDPNNGPGQLGTALSNALRLDFQ